MFFIAQFLSGIAIIINIISIQQKEKRKILFLFVLANLLFSIHFLLLKGYSGAVTCCIATVQTSISYYYETKQKVFPKVFIPIYIAVSILCGLFSYRTYFDLLPILCSIIYVFSIMQTKVKQIRLFTLFKVAVWVIYDFSVGAYIAGINDLILTISTMIAIIRRDIPKMFKKNS